MALPHSKLLEEFSSKPMERFEGGQLNYAQVGHSYDRLEGLLNLCPVYLGLGTQYLVSKGFQHRGVIRYTLLGTLLGEQLGVGGLPAHRGLFGAGLIYKGLKQEKGGLKRPGPLCKNGALGGKRPTI